MRATHALFSAALLAHLAGGCNRGPEPKPFDPTQAPPAASAEPTSQPAAPALPPGHPPMGGAAQAPQGLPSDHPPVGDTAQAPAAPAPSGSPSAGGLTWSAAAPLVARAPQSSMRAAEYTVAGGGADPAVLTVHYFPGMGGGVDANLDRWIGQFSQPDGKPSKDVAKIEKRSVAGLAITTVDVSGSYSAGMGPMMPGAAAGPQPGYRLLGAIAEAKEGPVFFKLSGPAADVQRAEAAFNALLESLKPAS